MKIEHDQTIANFLKSAANGLQLLGESLSHLADAIIEENHTQTKTEPVSKVRETAPVARKAARAKQTTAKTKKKSAPQFTSSQSKSDTDTVLSYIQKAMDGIDFDALLKLTGLNQKDLKSIIFNLIKNAEIDTLSGGIYVKRK